MALDERYIVASDLEQYFVDKDSGLPLANGTLTFFRDASRNVPKEVFQLSGSPPNYTYTSLGAEITLSAVGTVQDSGGDNVVIYYFPFDTSGNLDLYYVVCKDQNGVEQFTREAWPNVTAANNPATEQFPVQNQLSNPQFNNVFINPVIPCVYTVSAAVSEVFEFAPNWDFIISGTGTVTVQQIAVSGNDNIPTSPPYVIDINISSGVTVCFLRQRLNVNSGLWSSTNFQNIFLSGALIARNQAAGTEGVQMFYLESTGGTPILIVDASFDNSRYFQLSGSTVDALPQSNDTNTGKDGYVDIYLSFTEGSHIRISSIQVVPTLNNEQDILPYTLNTTNREEALQGDYYLPRLIQKRINSFLIGWDFPVNPYQFGSSGTITSTAAYIANQTIAVKSSAGSIAWSLDPITSGLKFVTSDARDAFCLIQYLTGGQVKNIISSRLAINLFAYQTTGAPVTARFYLFRGSSSSSIPVLPTILGTLSPSGTFVLTALNWTQIPRSGLPDPMVNLSNVIVNSDINDGNNDYGFSGFEITDSTEIGDTENFAIVATFEYPETATDITVNSISVIPDDLPCRPSIIQPITSARKIGVTTNTPYTTSSVVFVDVDSVNLSYTVTIPLGFNLHVIACMAADALAPADYSMGIFDSVSSSIVGWGKIQVDNVAIKMNTCTALISGDGQSHTVTLQWKTSVSTLTAQGNVNDTPTMDFLLVPSA